MKKLTYSIPEMNIQILSDEDVLTYSPLASGYGDEWDVSQNNQSQT